MADDPVAPGFRIGITGTGAAEQPRGPVPITERLATELYTIIRHALAQLGVDDHQQARAFERSEQLTAPEPVSGGIMRASWGLSDLLTEWSRASDYLDADGQPRILKIRGKGSTFESLVARFLPGRRIEDVIAMAQETAEVSLLSRGRIALLGSILVKTTAATPTLLAHTIRHLDQLLQTIVHNIQVDEGRERAESGRMERMVVGVIRKDRYDDFMALLRPQIYNLLMQVDAAVEQRAPATPEEIPDSSAISVGVYVGEEPDWARIGIDPLTVIRPKT